MRWFQVCSSLLVTGLLVAGGCSEDAPPAGPGAGGASNETFGAGECGTCMQEACAAQINACQSDPECPSYLSCLLGCPIAEDGNPEASCLEGCPVPGSSEGRKAAAELDACRIYDAGKSCTSCGEPPAQSDNPVVNQSCPDPSTETVRCFKCEDENCCQTYQSCEDSTACQDFEQCWKECFEGGEKEGTCRVQCAPGNDAGAELFARRWSCLVYECAGEILGCDASQRDACEVCLFSTCGDAYVDLESTLAGYLLSGCIVGCPIGDTVCDQSCFDTYPEAVPLYADYAACIIVACDGIC